MADYYRYRAGMGGSRARDETRQVATLRLTQRLRRQSWTLSLFGFFGLSDQDGYLRPRVAYRLDDWRSVELGGNWFFGRRQATFFGAFEDASSVYLAVRYSL